MPMNGYYYLPLTPGYFAILVVIYVIGPLAVAPAVLIVLLMRYVGTDLDCS